MPASISTAPAGFCAVHSKQGRSLRQLLTTLSFAASCLIAGTCLSPAVQAQTLTIGLPAGPQSMDPHYANAGPHAEAAKHIFDTLVWADNELEPKPRLAVSWKPLDDTTWEFKLRQGVKFHDGSDFTAEDVKFSIERIPNVSGPTPTTAMVRRVKEVQIIDPYTVHIVTNGPAPSLPNDFNRLFIVSAKAAKDYSTHETANAGFNAGKATIGTGPYKFVSWTPKNQLVLERFDGYWGGKQPWEKVVLKEIPNAAARIAQLKAGQVDLIARVSGTDVAALKQDSQLAVATHDIIYIFELELDWRDKSPQMSAKDGTPLPHNPFLDPRVRQAIDLAIDRPTLVEIAMEGLGTPANQFAPPFVFGHNTSLPAKGFDLAKAKQLMKEAGYPDGFKITLNFTNDRLPGDAQVGTTVAQMLARIGIDVVANPLPMAVFFPARLRGDFSMSMMGMGEPTGDAQVGMTTFLHTNDPAKKAGAFNWMGYSNAKFDQLLEDAGVEMNVDKRRAMTGQALAMVASDRPNIPLITIRSAWAMRKNKLAFTPRADEDTLAMNAVPPAKK
jgi:peptide/nickel transport system substrate-binding protein